MFKKKLLSLSLFHNTLSVIFRKIISNVNIAVETCTLKVQNRQYWNKIKISTESVKISTANKIEKTDDMIMNVDDG